jgi:cell division protein ZapE
MTYNITLDSAQESVWQNLQKIALKLKNHKASPLNHPPETANNESTGWKKWFSAAIADEQQLPKKLDNIYLWGDVGRGKTVLMHKFAALLPQAKVLHFHEFMQTIHQGMQNTRHQHKNQKDNPIFWVTREIAAKVDILCLDEFLVSDITDAMILSKILKSLQDHGVMIFTTSNFQPSELYKNGLQRAQFLPAIAHIESVFHIFNLDHQTDYRLTLANIHQRYFVTEQEVTEFTKLLNVQFAITTPPESTTNIHVQARDIEVYAEADNRLWVDFASLCETARSQLDYIEIAERYQTIFLDNVPVLMDEQRDITRRFMLLIDVFYDKGTTLFIHAKAPISELYEGHHWRFEFARTESRLFEMSS